MLLRKHATMQVCPSQVCRPAGMYVDIHAGNPNLEGVRIVNMIEIEQLSMY
jgi:hypothetical protein